MKNRWNSTLKRKLSLRATLDRNFRRTLNGEDVPDGFSHGVSYQQLTTEMTQLIHVLQGVMVEFSIGNPCITQEASQLGVTGPAAMLRLGACTLTQLCVVVLLLTLDSAEGCEARQLCILPC